MSRHQTCPTCGQNLPQCPACGQGVPRKQTHPGTWIIDEHKDGIGHHCAAAGLDYKHTTTPKGAA